MTLRYIISPGNSNEKVLTEDEIIRHNPVRTHTGLSDLTATIIEDRTLDSYAQRQDRLNVEVNGSVKWTGFIVGISHNIRRGNSKLRAEGIAKRLKETRPDYSSLGGSLTYTDIALEDAIDDYWSRTPFSNYAVTPQSTETIETQTTIQFANTDTEFENITNLSDTDPVVIQNGELQLAQSLFIQEGEKDTISGLRANGDYSNGEATFIDRGLSNNGEAATLDFDLDYTIPESNVAINFRIEPIDGTGDGISDTPEFTVSIDGNTFFVEQVNTNTLDLEWDDLGSSWSNGDLSAGSHTLKIEVTDASAGTVDDELRFDLFAVYDNRFSYNFDNSNDGSGGYLDGPELYPPSATTEFVEETASFNLAEADLNLTIDDTSGAQSLSLSFDSGSTFTTASNTNTLTAQPSNPTRSVLGKVTLSRYGTQTGATPLNGVSGQKIDAQEVLVDLNNKTVIDNLKLSRNHFENLQQLHEYGGWNWTIEHDASDIANMTVKSYAPEDETRTKPSSFADPIDERAEVQAEAYFNSIYLQGALDSGGDRPTAEEKDTTRINNDGREISPGVLRDPKITTSAGASFRAQSLLETALSNNELVGEKTLPSDTLIDPGYQYPVDFGNGDNNKTLEEVSLSESPDDVTIRARFTTPRSDLSAQIEDLRRTERDLGDNV